MVDLVEIKPPVKIETPAPAPVPEPDSTPIEEVLDVKVPEKTEDPVPPPKKVQFYKPPPSLVPQNPPAPKIVNDTTTELKKALIVGSIAAILASPVFRNLLTTVLPQFADGPLSYVFTFLIAMIIFLLASKVV
jgi:hypothetical protein